MQHQIINIDSKFCNKINNKGVYTFKFDEKISNVCSICVSSFEFPNIYYTFTQERDNVSFCLLYNSNKIVVQITEGSYTADQMITEINNAFQRINTIYGSQFKIEFDEITSKCTISNNLMSFQSSFGNCSDYQSLGKHLGFLFDTYTSKTDKNGKQSIIGDTILNTVGDTYMYIKVNNFGTMYTSYYSKSKMINDNILAKIIIKKNKGEYVYDNGSNLLSKYYNFMQPIDISVLNIELLDPHGKNIKLMGQDFSMTLKIVVNVGTINNINSNHLKHACHTFY